MNRTRGFRTAGIPKLAVGVVMLLSGAAVAETFFEGESKETLRIRRDPETGRVVTEQTRVNYHTLNLYNEAGTAIPIIARDTVLQTQDEGLEGIRSSLRVDLYMAKDAAVRDYPESANATVKIPDAHEAKFHTDHWTARTFGCCDAETYGRLYTYGGETPFLRFNESYWAVNVPNGAPEGRVRYVGMTLKDHVPNDSARAAIFGKQQDAVAAISYAAPGRPLDTIYLKPRKGVDWSKHSLHTEALSLGSKSPKDEVRREGSGDDHYPTIEMWTLDGAEAANKGRTDVSGVTVRASVFVDDGTSEAVTVTIENDRFVRPQMKGKLLEAVLSRGGE